MSTSLPFVSLVMPAYNEEEYIATCLRGLLSQDYPADRMEILVADGGSRDRTREIVERIAKQDTRVRLLDNSEHRFQSYGMNLGIKHARGEFLLITDVHAEYAPSYVSALVSVFQRTGADVAGGAQRPKADTPFQRALCAALSSPLGVGGAKYRSAENEGWVDTVFPGAFRRSILEKVGLYDVMAVTNEDAELQQRAILAGGRVYLSRDVVVHYFPRRSFRALSAQYFKYGDGRARTLLLHKRFIVLRPAVPFLGLVASVTMAATPPLRFLLLPAAAMYAIATGIEAVRHGRGLGLSGMLVTWAIFPTLHFSHAVGFATGLLKYALRPRPSLIETLPLTPSEGG